MKTLSHYSVILAVLFVSACASSGGSRDEGDYIGPTYHSSPWYYGPHYPYDYYDDYPDYIVTPQPPENRPERPGIDEPRPAHPIALPPGERPDRPDRATNRPSQRPSSMSSQRMRATPSIPSRPRPMGGRRGGGGRRR